MAGNTRFHNKYHFSQHHSTVTAKNTNYPDAATDPVASEELPFQGDFWSDGVIKVTSLDTAKYHFLGNDTTVDGQLTVTGDTLIQGSLTVDGNVFLKANPELGERVIEIGDAEDTDRVKFKSFIDSDIIPDPRDGSGDHLHDLGAVDQRWYTLYVNNLDLDGEFKVGACGPDSTPTGDRGFYINTNANTGAPARVGINNCDPTVELDIVGHTTISNTLNVGIPNRPSGSTDGDTSLHGNLTLDGYADIGGVVELVDDNPIYWETTDCEIVGNNTNLLFRNPNTIQFIAAVANIDIPHIDLSTQDVTIALNDTQSALNIDDCTFHIDALNDRVGINTCTPSVDFEVQGSVKLEGETLDIDTTGKITVDSAAEIEVSATGDVEIESTGGDFHFQAPTGSLEVISKTLNVFVADDATFTADKLTATVPEIITTGQRVDIIATDNIQLISPKLDLDVPLIDTSTQNVTVELKEDVDALNIKTGASGSGCLVKLDTLNNRVGINQCTPTVPFDVVGDTKIDAPDSIILDSANDMDFIVVDTLKTTADFQQTIVQNQQISVGLNRNLTVHQDNFVTVNNDNTEKVYGDHDSYIEGTSTEQIISDVLKNISGTSTVNIARNETHNVHTWNDVPSNRDVNVDGIATFNSGLYTNFTTGKVGYNITDPFYRISIPCGDKIGTHQAEVNGISPERFGYIEFCDPEVNSGDGTVDALSGHDLTIRNFGEGDSDIRLVPDRNVLIPNGNVGINTTTPEKTLHVDGDTLITGELTVDSGIVDSQLIANRGIYKDEFTNQLSTTDNFYYDGQRVGLRHLPDILEDATLYVADGPIKLETLPGAVLVINSSQSESLGVSVTDTTSFTGALDHNISFNLANTSEDTAFAIRYSSAKSGTADKTGLILRHEDTNNRPFLGFNTTDNIGANGNIYDARLDAYVNITDNLYVDSDIDVEKDQRIGGNLTINSNQKDAGLIINSGKIELRQSNNKFVFSSKESLPPGPVPGSGSIFGSQIASALDEHFVLDLRNTSIDHRFALRYSAANTGVVDSLAVVVGNDTDGMAHVGINTIPDSNYHLDVNGDMRVTGTFTVQGASTTIQAANMTVEDKNITLNVAVPGPSTSASANDAGIWIQGDNDEIVGYWKVHPTETDKLVAKAPTGAEVLLDINGTQTSPITLEDTSLNIKTGSVLFDDTTFDALSSDIDVSDSTVSITYNGYTNPITGMNRFLTKLRLYDSTYDSMQSIVTLDQSDITHTRSQISTELSSATINNSLINITNSSDVALAAATLSMTTGTSLTVDNSSTGSILGDFTAEASSTSVINQDVTSDSTSVTFDTLGITSNLDVGKSLVIPIGDDAARPAAPGNGDIRYNTVSGLYEGCILAADGTAQWVPFNRTSDEDNDTYITPQPGGINTDDDTLSFVIGGVEVGTINGTEFNFTIPIINNVTTGLTIPVGLTIERPDPANPGAIRYNTDLTMFEGYDGSNWGGLGGVIDVDQDTMITAESTPSADEDVLKFYAGSNSTVRASIDATKTTIHNLEVTTNAKVTGTATVNKNNTYVTVGGPSRHHFNAGNLAVLGNPNAAQTEVGMVAGNNYYTITHNLNEQYPLVQVYDNKRRMIIPDEIHLVSASQVSIDLSSHNVTGTWHAILYV